MTEKMANREAWAPREERRVSPRPAEIPPHPDHGDLPPCEAGIKTDHPCPRAAKWHYGYVYYCDEHMDAERVREDYSDAELSVHHARRFLWKAQVEDLENLAHHIGDALSELEQHRRNMEEQLDRAEARADAPRALR